MTPDEIRAAFERKGLEPTTWGNAPGDTYGAHSHGYRKDLLESTGDKR